ncbi:dihydrolipoamide acetyltransferase family protein [Antarctobacter sp.]|uniref:dihydrolipoamide acetyltransferase family protein n=1 Tax=Antarctobacter sp. TaxID=1872577 RepID=UPI002B267D47|nr:dihydrolipoamide acetyltransferase family protein [Antarctobacter sp.]
MPSLGSDMDSGRLVEWLIAPGDTVSRGDVVAVVETQKGAIEIETFEAGSVQELIAPLNADLAVGAPLAIILAEGEAAPKAATSSQPEAPDQSAVPVSTAPVAVPTAPAPTTGPHPASPAARKRAAELGIDLAGLTGTGPGGAILLGDLEKTAPEAPTPRPATDLADEMRKAIAAAMTRSKQTIPHFYLSQTIDIDPAMRFLENHNAGQPPAGRVLLGALLVRAASLAASQVPEVNGHYTDERGFVPSDAVNPGVAIALRGGGLVAPALLDAANLTLAETMAGMRDLVGRARAGRLKASEMTRGTITISSLGESGAEAMTGVIFPPQVAVVGLGAPQLRPWIVDGDLVPRHVVTLTLSADHRVSDGRSAARFVTAFETLLKDPEAL